MSRNEMYENEGVVATVSEKEWYDRRKDKDITLYSFQIEGSRRWFRTGETAPPFEEGDYVTFENDAKGNVDVDSIEVSDEAPRRKKRPAKQSAPARRSTSKTTRKSADSGGQTRDGYWAEKERRDIEREQRYQEVEVPRISFTASRAAAVQLMQAAATAGVLDAKDLDEVLMLTDMVTDKFFVDAMSAQDRLATLVAPEAEKVSDNDDEEDYDDE